MTKRSDKKTDLVYIKKGLFTTFLPESKEGEIAWGEMLENPQTKNATIYTIHLKSVLYQLKKAGYVVKKAKKVTDKELNDIFQEFDALGI